MTIVHRPEKSHSNANDLSRLLTNYVDTHCFSIVVITTNNDFLIKLRDDLKSDPHFRKIYDKIEQQVKDIANNFEESNTMYQSYRLSVDDELLHLINKFNSNRICILNSLER